MRGYTHGQPVVKSIIFLVNRRLLTVLGAKIFGNFIIGILYLVLFCQIGRQISHTHTHPYTQRYVLHTYEKWHHFGFSFKDFNQINMCASVCIYTFFSLDKNKNNFRIPFLSVYDRVELLCVNKCTRSLPSIEK